MALKFYERLRRPPLQPPPGPADSLAALAAALVEKPAGVYGVVLVKRGNDDADFVVVDLKNLEEFFNQTIILREDRLTPIDEAKQLEREWANDNKTANGR